MTPPARTAEQRKQDVLDRLENDVDAWVTTADPASGTPYMVPLSFFWEGATLLIATPGGTPTGRNLRSSGKVRLGVGRTRDVVLIEGTAEPVPDEEISEDLGVAFAAKTGFDPRAQTISYTYFRVRPDRLQAWREVNELAGRDLMRDGAWLV
ncbi:pyridoxamine 5'-phosphate oxidase family protein [Actinomadura macra]|uniref:pyridoxamine 5'-phosphate oxidase family protein n=1 Tax=Actinomadura macra TaxID=46164 RepID=UPI00082E3D7D|nr:pyridoxamine 5'-phosphate oxidase family protein [Actinomadura macra]